MNLILEQLGLIYGRSGFLIPGRAPNTAMTTHSINRYCARIWAVLFDKHNITKFTPHDSRRTISTRLSEKEVMPHVTEKMLGHAMQGVMAVYNKHDWIKEQLSGYELYWQLIENSIQEELGK
jgi:integrase